MRSARFIASALALAAVVNHPAQAQTTTTSQPRPPRAPTTTGLPSAPMPVQKQSLEYFVGTWTFKWTGPETPLGPGPRTGTLTFAPRDGGQVLEGTTDAKSDEGAYRETLTLRFDADKKMLAWSERRPGGVELEASGDWSSPLAIAFDVAPVTVKGQTYRIRRRLAVISAGSFSVTDEYAVGDGPFKRLGNGLFTRQPAAPRNGDSHHSASWK